MSNNLLEKSTLASANYISLIGGEQVLAACERLSKSVTCSSAKDSSAELDRQQNQAGGYESGKHMIYDFSYAWRIAWSLSLKIFFYTTIFLMLAIGAGVVTFLNIESWFFIVFFGSLFAFSSLVFFRVWKAHQPAVIFQFGDSGWVSFCAQDMENNIFDFIFFRRLRNAWKRVTLQLSDIYRVDNEVFTVLGGIKYFSLNLSGRFGSQKIVFSNKQKRDECRALFSVAIKKYAKDARMDSNLSVGSSGDSGY